MIQARFSSNAFSRTGDLQLFNMFNAKYRESSVKGVRLLEEVRLMQHDMRIERLTATFHDVVLGKVSDKDFTWKGLEGLD